MKSKITLIILGSTLLLSSLSFITPKQNSIHAIGENVTEVSITSSTDSRNLGNTDPIAPNGRRFTFIFPSGTTIYDKKYSGKVYDLGHQEHDVVFVDAGGESGGRKVLCYLKERLNSIIIMSDDLFVRNDDTSYAIQFDKSYKITYPSQEYTPAIVEEYVDSGMSIVGSTQACNVNESFAKRWYDLLVTDGTSYQSEYTGYVYDLEGAKYEAHLKDIGSDASSGKRKLRFAIPLRLDIMCIYSSSVFFENTTKEPIKFDLDYQVKYPKIEYRPATITTFIRPTDLYVTASLLEGKHSFTSYSFTGDIHYKEGDLIPSYISTIDLKLTYVGIDGDNTNVTIDFSFSNRLEKILLKRGTIFKSKTAPFELRMDQSYLLTKNGEKYEAEPFINDKSTIRIGNTGNTRSWATNPLTPGDLPYTALISFTDSLMKGLYNVTLANYYYTGFVYDNNDNPIQARLYLISPKTIVDITSFKLGIYVASNEKSFKIKKDELFSQEGVSTLPAFASFEENYLISYSPNTSDVEVTILGEGGGETTDVPPTIYYSGSKTLNYQEGDCVPLLFVKAKDYFNQDVLVKTRYSEGTHDSNYRLLKGNHTITLIATDKYGNVSTVTISLVVS